MDEQQYIGAVLWFPRAPARFYLYVPTWIAKVNKGMWRYGMP